jgi:hypothetical protein
MTRLLTGDQLEGLGLDPTRIGESVTLAWPEEGAAHGRGLGDAVIGVTALLTANYAGIHFGAASVPLAEPLGISIDQAEEDPRILKVTGPADAVAEVRMLPPALPAAPARGPAWARDPRDPATVLLDLRPSGSAGGAVVLPTGEGLLIVAGPSALEVTLIHGELSLPPLVEIRAPVAGWIAPHHVPWLRDEIQARLERADSWQEAVAVGLFARHAVASDRTTLDAASEADLVRPRQWARGLGPAEVETIDLLLEAEVERLLMRLEALAGTMACDDAAWRADLVTLCRARDDVEGVRLLLNEAGAGGSVEHSVELLDEIGASFVRSLPVVLSIDDARLREVIRFDHTAWWAALAAADV